MIAILRVQLIAALLAPSVPAQIIIDTAHGRTITIKVVNSPPAPADTPVLHELRPGHPLLVELTTKARRVLADTIWVYSSLQAPHWPYSGKALDNTFEGLFAPIYPDLTFPHDDPELFATARFVLDPQHVGYLLRVPGMYESTALELWIYDARSMRFALPERLAESWGDEGCGFDLESLLVRTGDQLQLLVHKNTGCSDIETGKVLSNNDSLWIRTWTRGAFAARRLSTDTTLMALFAHQRDRLPH